ncbi:hypothetical protein KP509_27G041900 [Ceratopteris richardii]|nr:hypothetical protein KP509_27G041900 [Ceratopteris richardii]
MDILLWNTWRGHILWAIWLSRNNRVFGHVRRNFFISLPKTLKKVAIHCTKSIVRPSQPPQVIHSILYEKKYSCWKGLLAQIYSGHRFAMMDSL